MCAWHRHRRRRCASCRQAIDVLHGLGFARSIFAGGNFHAVTVGIGVFLHGHASHLVLLARIFLAKESQSRQLQRGRDVFLGGVGVGVLLQDALDEVSQAVVALAIVLFIPWQLVL